MTDLPKEVAQPDYATENIPQEVAVLPNEQEAPEATPYVISFVKYNDRMCELSLLGGNKAKRTIETLKTVGTKIKSTADYQRHSVDRIPVRKEGAYRRLYNGLPEETELKEIKLQQNARVFYFDIEPERTFYVVAITENHIETDQVRR